jgi:tetratricopeptide (TPR) repeat protein
VPCHHYSRLLHFIDLLLPALQLKDFVSAIRDYTRALEVDANNAYAYYNRGISHDRNGDYMQAIDDFSAAIRLLPTNADFYHNRGFCYRKKNDFEAAVKDYTRALEIDPRHFKAIYNRGFSYDKVHALRSVVLLCSQFVLILSLCVMW